jgi:hypothetical protein
MTRRDKLKYAALVCVLLLEPGYIIYLATTPGRTGIYIPPSIAIGIGAAALAVLAWWVLRGRRDGGG